MEMLFVWHTHLGPFYIARGDDGHFHPVYADESLDGYATPELAAGALALGRTTAIAGGVDTADLNIPADLAEWTRYIE